MGEEIPVPALKVLLPLTLITSRYGWTRSEMLLVMAEVGANIVSINIPQDPGVDALEKAITDVGRKLTTFECDVGDSAALRATFNKIWQSGVVPDILLNCAGLNRRGSIEEMMDEMIDLVGNSPRNGHRSRLNKHRSSQ